jgi:hypothetical protein
MSSYLTPVTDIKDGAELDIKLPNKKLRRFKVKVVAQGDGWFDGFRSFLVTYVSLLDGSVTLQANREMVLLLPGANEKEQKTAWIGEVDRNEQQGHSLHGPLLQVHSVYLWGRGPAYSASTPVTQATTAASAANATVSDENASAPAVQAAQAFVAKRKKTKTSKRIRDRFLMALTKKISSSI